MNRRMLLILIGLFAALVVLTLIQSAPPAVSEAEPTKIVINTETFPYQRVFPNLGAADIQAVRLRDPAGDKSFVMTRGADGTWTNPEGKIDANAASIIEKSILLLPYQRTVPLTASTKLSEFGFNPNGQLFIEIALQNNEGHVVAIGNLSASGANYYALVDERPEIYLLERGATDYLLTVLNNPPLT